MGHSTRAARPILAVVAVLLSVVMFAVMRQTEAVEAEVAIATQPAGAAERPTNGPISALDGTPSPEAGRVQHFPSDVVDPATLVPVGTDGATELYVAPARDGRGICLLVFSDLNPDGSAPHVACAADASIGREGLLLSHSVGEESRTYALVPDGVQGGIDTARSQGVGDVEFISPNVVRVHPSAAARAMSGTVTLEGEDLQLALTVFGSEGGRPADPSSTSTEEPM